MNHEITRLLSVTSIHQLTVGITCLRINHNNSFKYHDYLVINNILLTNEAKKKLYKFAKIHDFKNIIDLTSELNNFNNKIITTRIIFIWRNVINYIKLLCFNKITYYNSNYGKKLITMLNERNVDEIYIRYKLNLAERLIVKSYPNANIVLFEDGAGDYITSNNKIQLKFSIPNIIKSWINFSPKYIINMAKLKEEKLIYKKTKNHYELISSKSSILKNRIKSITSKEFITISDDYLSTIHALRKSVSVNLFHTDYILFLSTLSTPTNPVADSDMEEIKIITAETLSTIKSCYNGKKVFIKTHPRIPLNVKNMFLDQFVNEMMPDEFDHLPAEIFFHDKNLVAVFGEYSSSLIYASKIFHKPSYYTKPADIIFWNEEEINRNNILFNQMGVRGFNMKSNINSNTSQRKII